MKIIHGLLLALVSVFITACATTGGKMQAKNITAGSAGVYVYRIPSSLGASTTHEIFINGQRLGQLRNGSYLKTALQPGEHVITLRDNDTMNKAENKHYTFRLRAHEKHYVQIMWTPSGKQKRLSARGFVDWLPHYGAKLVKANPSLAAENIRTLSESQPG